MSCSRTIICSTQANQNVFKKIKWKIGRPSQSLLLSLIEILWNEQKQAIQKWEQKFLQWCKGLIICNPKGLMADIVATGSWTYLSPFFLSLSDVNICFRICIIYEWKKKRKNSKTSYHYMPHIFMWQIISHCSGQPKKTLHCACMFEHWKPLPDQATFTLAAQWFKLRFSFLYTDTYFHTFSHWTVQQVCQGWLVSV